MRNEQNDLSKPFKLLGGYLKTARQKLQESLAEVSGAVEIDIDTLAQIEKGEKRPSEEVLLLLISHFNMPETEAANLWEMAGYTNGMLAVDDQTKQQISFAMPMDVRVVYTDLVHVMVNNYGVVMNFMQNSGPGNQPLAIARVGMSKEHAKSVLEVLQKTLAQSERSNQPKKLPAHNTKKQKSDT